jgi:hypothetical protein
MGEVNMGLAIIVLCMLKSIGLQMFTQSKYDREWVSPPFSLCTEVYLLETPKCAFYSHWRI